MIFRLKPDPNWSKEVFFDKEEFNGLIIISETEVKAGLAHRIIMNHCRDDIAIEDSIRFYDGTPSIFD